MLISYINRLGELAKNDQPNPAERELFLRFLDFLENYIFTHFKDEEGCMHRLRRASQCSPGKLPIRGMRAAKRGAARRGDYPVFAMRK